MEDVRELHTISLLFTYCPSNAIFNDTNAAVAKRLKMRAVVEKLKTKLLMLRVMYEQQTGEFEKNVQLVVFSCPLSDKCKSCATIALQNGTGFAIPFKHLVPRVSDGDSNNL